MSWPMGASGGMVLAASLLFVWLWGHSFRRIGESEKRRIRIHLGMVSRLGVPVRYAFSLFATVYYIGAAGIGVLLISLLGKVKFVQLWTFNLEWFPLIFLGVIATVSVSSFCMALLYTVRPRVDVPGAVRDIQWIQGVYLFPPYVAQAVVALSACFEELLFRGVVLTALLQSGWTFPWALAVVTAMFVYEQVVLADTALQKFVLSVGSTAVSVVGGLLLGYTGSIIPAMIVHGSFAAYYTQAGVNRTVSTDTGRVGVWR